MSWLVILIGSSFVLFTFWLIFSDVQPTMPGNEDGKREKPIDLEDLLPISYDDRLEDNKQLRSEHERAYKAFVQSALDDAIEIYKKEISKKVDYSAVVELNAAKLSQEKYNRYRDDMTIEERQSLQDFIKNLVERAVKLIEQAPHHYPTNIKTYLQNFKDIVNELPDQVE
jgi:predicted metal-dependent phosphoesterase TrpH